MVKRRFARATAALSLVFGLLYFGPAPALAVTCSGSGCNGKSPVTTGCANDVVQYASHNIYGYTSGDLIGVVQLRGSPTCKTRWSRVVSYIGGQALGTEIIRSDGLRYDDLDTYPTTAYSPMVYRPSGYTARACGSIGIEGDDCTGYH